MNNDLSTVVLLAPILAYVYIQDGVGRHIAGSKIIGPDFHLHCLLYIVLVVTENQAHIL